MPSGGKAGKAWKSQHLKSRLVEEKYCSKNKMKFSLHNTKLLV